MIDSEEMTGELKGPCLTEIDPEDRISNLPRNITDQILSRLSIRDGARTSVLSKTWRCKWSELPSLVFDNSLGVNLKFPEFASIVDHVVLLHRSPILKFEYSSDRGTLNLERRAMDRWIMHLSKSPIQECAISTLLDGYCLPPCLFGCQSLTKLSLSCGSIIKLPSTFKGFPNLKSLSLDLQKIGENDLERLISRCPVLESLDLEITNYLSHVKVVAPNLLFFTVEGNIGVLSFENASRLGYVSIALHDYGEPEVQVCSNSSNLFKFCAQLPMIRQLTICSAFLEYLAVGVDPSNLPSSCTNLYSLTLCMNLNVRGDCFGAPGILGTFQNLHELRIEVNSHGNGTASLSPSEANVWDDMHLNFRFNNLQLVAVKGVGIMGTERELEFVRFMLSASPVLESMVIKANLTVDHYGTRTKMMVKKLLSFKRASAQAQVFLEGY